jgi:DNA-binding response OmpR family regulator
MTKPLPFKPKVLLVENEPDIRRLVSYVLVAEGFEVTEAYDAPQADARLEEGRFDIILLDLMLPGEDGYSFCRRIKARGDCRDVPVVMISARVMPEEIRRGLECGAAAYITKPYDPRSLAGDIRRILSGAGEKPAG